jgi:2-methylfumaryl-CoA isomerase
MYDLLKGLRVVEGVSFVASPSCGLYLAQMGAEVIRFDSIGGGPDFNRWPLAPGGASLYWEGLNKGKKSIAINLATPAGRELAAALATAPGPDNGLFVTNYPVGGFLSYENLRKRRADLICVRVMGWSDGAPGMDYTINAAVGVPDMTGPEDAAAPQNPVVPTWDFLAGAYAAFAVLAADRDRRATGKGREIRVSLSDIAASALSNMGFVGDVLVNGQDRPRFGNALYGGFGRDFVTRDGQRVMLVALTGRQWNGLLRALNLGAQVATLEAETGADFAKDEGARFTHRRRLFPLFEAAIGARTLGELGPAFDEAGATWGQYQSLYAATHNDERLFTANPMFEQITHPSGHRYLAAGPPAALADEARMHVQRAPRLGEHTDEILATLLGLSGAQIAALHDSGTIAGADGH